MDFSDLLHRLRDALPSWQERLAARSEEAENNILEPKNLSQIRHDLEPSAAAKARVWQRIEAKMEPQRANNLLTQVSRWLEPDSALQTRVRTLMTVRLAPAPAPAGGLGFAKWTVAFLIFALVIKSSPLLFIAPRTVAATSVSLSTTRGTVSVGDEGLLQPVTGEVTLEAPGRITTGDGEATLILHTYGVVRLASNTVFVIEDLAHHPTLPVTGSLTEGTAWVYGLIPNTIAGISLETPAGIVTVNEGSANLTVRGSTLTVDAWDRAVHIAIDGEEYVLQSAQRLVAASDAQPRVSTLDPSSDDAWVAENFTRDAAHRRELAQWQREIRVANAGILPTSPLYPVKRAAEAMDLLLTFGGEARTQKTLAQAETRLNEAVALLAEESANPVATTSQVIRLAASGSTVPAVTTDATGSGAIVRSLLDEYRSTILTLAERTADVTSSGATTTAAIVTNELASSTVELSAVLPSDAAYPLKQAVLATAAALPETANEPEIERETVLLDALASLRTSLQAEPEADLSDLADLTPLLGELRSDIAQNSAEIQREASALEQTILSLTRQRRDDVAVETASRRGPTMPAPLPRLSELEIENHVARILANIEIYRLPASRFNQLVAELKATEGMPDEGQILRRLDAAITDEPGLSARLHARMRQLKEQRAAENSQSTGSNETVDGI